MGNDNEKYSYPNNRYDGRDGGITHPIDRQPLHSRFLAVPGHRVKKEPIELSTSALTDFLYDFDPDNCKSGKGDVIADRLGGISVALASGYLPGAMNLEDLEIEIRSYMDECGG